ncbi:pleckstrin homology domain-containing family J member 1 isoform X2 [Emydura macquarii macquarii]|uniref:pleckstrin homology domain-containing family J member 1 isoform X2 n=1 Tax=Emydura macquarii macquarii TaxID=1129001 RepID=UPI00352B8BCA
MRYNERELLSLSRQPAEKAAEILMRVPKKGSVLKKRLVKLVVNFLFYFRTDEAEPIGALLLEHCRITKEEENVFSISHPHICWPGCQAQLLRCAEPSSPFQQRGTKLPLSPQHPLETEEFSASKMGQQVMAFVMFTLV